MATVSAESLHCWLTNSDESGEEFAKANANMEIDSIPMIVFFILFPYFLTTRWTAT